MKTNSFPDIPQVHLDHLHLNTPYKYGNNMLLKQIRDVTEIDFRS